ncbi:1-deoxy-D-xylulose-5-phosphate reductoisomerase [Sphingobacterium psychroaquaticum]|uniref:1-deoxy-D-xylulose 5-phosphate reductoisomerase n=1 Tax=Sphingobacterium psychroaquaticum TaxID=561061 RepID=A0A1X7LDJ3_9SPHI|nr:1-deoxy-D-xylulose-5-phosphate reductoisomerase [Sphingobacterium psychroaquaticum]SMG51835.1 1-deoxy-D-xylulose 5-phosphate reductoisomerase [Sphingobacterium psychroaquaticum]
MNKRNIAILGATGSIGTQALDVVRAFPELLEVSVLTGARNVALLIEQALEFRPKAVVITDESAYKTLKEALAGTNIRVLSGVDALVEVVTDPEIDVLLNAIVGAAGLKPTVVAIEHGKDIALANKETLVVAGELVMGLAEKHQVKMLPVDSEHSAIFQCLVGEEQNPIEKIYLTASGGPFRGKGRLDLMEVTKAQALLHPNWVMGAKITIDSASLMNKGLEVIEAKWLFDLEVDQIDVIVHPQSIVHSIVQFQDGSMKAQMGVPDMKLPIQNALTYPLRMQNSFERFDFLKYPTLTFEPADQETFRNLELAYSVLRAGGDRACVLNAANEIAVEAFLNDQISFLGMSDLIEATLCQQKMVKQPTLNDYIAIDQQTRLVARDLIDKI